MEAIRTKRRGPVPRPGRVRVTLYLDEPLAQWGKHQKGGLSELVRSLLAEAQQRHDFDDDYPADLRAAYQGLIDQKLSSGLSAAQEHELTLIRAQINGADRASASWRRQERAAEIIESQLANLRREIEMLPERVSSGK